MALAGTVWRFAFLGAPSLVLLLASACGGDSAPATPRPAPTTSASSAPSAVPTTPAPTATRAATPAPTVTPASDACPAPDATLCTFATALQKGLQSGDVNAIAAAFKQVEVTCVQPGQGPDPAAALCQGHATGDKVAGYGIGGRNSGGVVATRGTLLQFLSKFAIAGPVNQHDDFGDWLVRLYTVGSPPGGACAPGCPELVYSYIARAAPNADRYVRQAMVFDVEKSASGGWTITTALDGTILPGEVPALLSGGTLEGRTYRPWSPGLGAAPATTKARGAGGPFLLGDSVKVASAGGGCADRKATPGKAAAAIDCLKGGTQLVIEAGPVDAEGARFWRIRVADPGAPAAAGWVAADQMAP